MARQNINLGWLYGALGGDVDAKLNPGFQSGIDPSTGQFVDVTGKPITEDQFWDNPDKPYITPTVGQRIFAPDAASTETAGNNAWTLKGPEAQQNEAIQKGIVTSRYGGIPSSLKPSGFTDDNLYSTGYTGRQTPTELNSMNVSASDAQGGIVPIRSQDDIATAQSNLAAAKDFLSRQPTLFKTQAATDQSGLSDASFNLSRRPLVHSTTSLQDTAQNISSARSLERQPVEEAVLDQGAVNRLHSVTGVDPQQIELTAKQLTADLGREPREEELREYLLDSKMKEAQISRGLTDINLQDSPLLQQVQRAQNRRALMESTHMPPMSNPAMLDRNGNVVRNPLGLSTAMQGMYGMQSLPTPSGSSLKNNNVINTGTGFNIIPTPKVVTTSSEVTRPLPSSSGLVNAPYKPIEPLQKTAKGVYDVDTQMNNILQNDQLTSEQKSRLLMQYINNREEEGHVRRVGEY